MVDLVSCIFENSASENERCIIPIASDSTTTSDALFADTMAGTSNSGRRLPPLSLSANTDQNTVTETPIKRKKKRLVDGDEGGEQSPRRTVPPRPVSGAGPADGGGRPDEKPRARTLPHRETTTATPIKRPRKAKPADSEQVDECEPESPKPQKRKKPKSVTASQEHLVNSHETNGDLAAERSPHSANKPKKRKKKRPQVGQSQGPGAIGLEADLHDLEDDVVASDSGAESAEDNHWNAQGMRSEPVPKLFIEQASGFKQTSKVKVAQKRAEQAQRAVQVPTVKPTQTTSQFAVSTHKGFKTITVFFQGLFAGLCLWQIVTVWLLSNQSWDNLLSQYYMLALPVQSVYYWLFAVSLVAVFDRYDVARPSRRFVVRSLAFQTGAISCFFYFSGLVLSLAIAATDDKIGMSQDADKDPPLWGSTEDRDSELNTWRIINLMRGLMAMLGWFVVSLRPGTDLLTKNLVKADENIIEEAGAIEAASDVIRSSGV